jgi:hypothetical protein
MQHELRTVAIDLAKKVGGLVKRGQLMRPSFGEARTFGASRVPGALPLAEVPRCPQAQSGFVANFAQEVMQE